MNIITRLFCEDVAAVYFTGNVLNVDDIIFLLTFVYVVFVEVYVFQTFCGGNFIPVGI